ncbi:hypothetical protein COU14_02375 [Candidatus Kaiserbacteria bacterium CG10_big_fil_rev_8_21_14_0_10_44_10]|uniref:DUF3467 domain-containing protein n=1 Tax=Candidatus Kaiserbacteria bacterium CG10_big_fil_rev_8_21_14_0_10_44_10 TaxID=1974606 RepID=A0A2H0UHE0_9BACT|nr:MAG: hypothetical protein COU14_02375 [Candidatus Kaiserbacteria bacterium CG10_big_fil_rev_8_21_14_0_10_44_10]
MKNQENYEMMVACQSYRFEIQPQPNGSLMGLFTFYARPLGAENPNNQVLSKVVMPLEAAQALHSVVEDALRKHREKTQNK